MAKTRIEGRDLMVFNANEQSFAFATNSALTISTSLNEINDKDIGAFGASEPGKVTWSITTDNIFDIDSFYTLYDWQLSGDKAKVYFGLKQNYKGSDGYNAEDCVNDANSSYTYWSPNKTDQTGVSYASYCLCGYVYLTDLSVNASATDKANYSATMQGTGTLSKVRMQ